MAIKPLPSSPFRKTCETCLYWIKSEREQYYPTEQGGVIAVKDISAKNLPPGAVQLGLGKIELAPCAVAPQWAHTKPDHWCWQHSGAVKFARRYTEQNCPGHVASIDDKMTCAHCGTNINSLR